MATDLERFRDHARRMAAGRRPQDLQGPAGPITDADRAEWTRLADEADEQLRREAEDEGLFAAPEPEPAEPGLW